MATDFESNKYVIFVLSTKIGTHENKAIHSSLHKMLVRHYFACEIFVVHLNPSHPTLPRNMVT